MKWALLKATAGRWLLPAVVALAVAGIGTAWWHGYSTGKTAQTAAMQSELDKAMQRQAETADELEQARAARRPEVRTVIRYVDRVIDGCADVPVPDGVRAALGGSDG